MTAPARSPSEQPAGPTGEVPRRVPWQGRNGVTNTHGVYKQTMTNEKETLKEVLINEGPDGYMMVESTMKRGSTHNSDKTRFTSLVSRDDFANEVGNLRDAQKADMVNRRSFDPDEGGD